MKSKFSYEDEKCVGYFIFMSISLHCCFLDDCGG